MGSIRTLQSAADAMQKKVRFMQSICSVGASASEAIETAAAGSQQEQEDYLLDVRNGKVLKCGVHFGVEHGKHAVAAHARQ